MRTWCVVGVVAMAGVASGSSFSFISERSGNTFSATLNGESVFIGILGFNNAAEDQFVAAEDIMGSWVPGGASTRVVGLFNGLEVRPWDGATVEFASGAGLAEIVSGPLSLNEFDGVTFNSAGRQFETVLFAFTGTGSLSIRDDAGRTRTWNAKGTLGDLGELAVGAPVIPLPTPAAMGAVAMLGLAGVRRRR